MFLMMLGVFDDVSTIHPLSFVFSAAVSDKQDPHLLPWLLCALLYGMTTITDKSIFKFMDHGGRMECSNLPQMVCEMEK